MTWVLPLGLTRPPLTANERTHHMAKAPKAKRLRALARDLAESHGVPAMARCSVALVWLVTDGRKRDEDNVVPTLKHLCDGLVDAGVVPDDVPAYMDKAMPIIARAEKKEQAGMYLIVWPAEGTPERVRLLDRLARALGVTA